MTSSISFTSKIDSSKIDALAILIDERLSVSKDVLELDSKVGNLITHFLKANSSFKGKYGEIERISTVSENSNIINIFLVGTGSSSDNTEPKIENLGGKILSVFKNTMSQNCAVELASAKDNVTTENMFAVNIASGIALASYKFDRYHTKLSEKEKFIPSSISINCTKPEDVKKIFEDYKKPLCAGVHFARDLVSMPPNKLNPETYAETIAQKLGERDVEVTVLGEREMKDLGMHALLGVGQGSAYESKLVIMEYNGTKDKDQKPVALVGKGVTFDTGGISLKPSNNMWDMKYDMAGSAAVVGAVSAAAQRKANVNIVGIVALVENMPSGDAQRPSDIVKSMSGQTIEVLNTDAEGRLILADALHYVQENFKPEYIIDLATLTGAILVALGTTYGGMFTHDDSLASDLEKAGSDCGEHLWRMPMHQDYDDMIKSSVADVANIGISNKTGFGGAAGSSTAAHFLGRFIQNGVKWAHLDIAGMAWSKPGTSISPSGATGFGVRLLNQFLKTNHEK